MTPESKNPPTPPAVEKCAALSRLDVTAEEIQQLAGDFDRILEAFRGLTELDVSDVEPMLGAVDLQNILRADESAPSLSMEKLLRAAPKTADGFFCVPKTVESGS